MASRRRHHPVSFPAGARPPAAGRASRRGAAGSAASAKATENAGAEAREVEWQLTAADLPGVRHWLEQHSVLDGLSIEPLPAQQLHDTYLDTDDWRILRAGFALRLRDKGGQPEATLKGLRSAQDDVADRREITESLAAATAKSLARATGPVASRVRDVVGVKPLRTLFEVRTSRERFAVRGRSPTAHVGEIALDEARFTRHDGHRRPMVLTRVELEAAGPDSAPLQRLSERLCAECGLHRAAENKFAVGLRSASLEPPPDARPDGEAEPPPAIMDASTGVGDFAAGMLQRLLREWQACEPAARLGEGPEPLHKLRVAARRMDTVLNLFRGCLPAALAKSRPTLKGLVDVLGEVRDVDIRLQEVTTFRNDLPEGDRPALEPLLRHLESERAAARAAMLRALDAKPAREWLDALPEQLARAAAAPASPSRNAAALAVVPDLIRKRYRKLCKCAGQLTPDSPMREFHKTRIRAKKLRYAMEVVAPTYAKPAERMIITLQKMQSRLGTQHDADVLARYLAQLATHPPADFTAATLFLMGRMAQQHAAEAARLGRKFEKPWRKVRDRRWKALRSRMNGLRGGRRSGTLTGTANGKMIGAAGMRTSPQAGRH